MGAGVGASRASLTGGGGGVLGTELRPSKVSYMPGKHSGNCERVKKRRGEETVLIGQQ